MSKQLCRKMMFLLLLLPAALVAQIKPYDIHIQGENYKVSYVAIPPQLESILVPLTSYSYYRWESSTMPLSGFVTASGVANGANYTFTSPIGITSYFRRVCNLNGTEFISNTIKLEVVSINYENMNYIREHNILVQGQSDWTAIDQLSIGDKLQTTTYLDNLGRPLQKVSKGTATPAPTGIVLGDGGWEDIVQFSAYDALSRKAKNYLPYTTLESPGKFKPNHILDQESYYATNYQETAPYSNVSFDNSPLNRATKVNAPGTSWATSAGNRANYEVNTVADWVIQYSIGYAETDLPTVVGLYPYAQLIKTTNTDENGKLVVEYINKSGQLILKKVQLDDVPADNYNGWICTYNVYDDFGQLRFQIQPEAVKWLNANGWTFGAFGAQQVSDNLCFTYMYDAKGRNIYKKAPGAKPLYMIYDNRDLPAFTQDGNQRLKVPAEWTAYFYDILFRPTKTALYKTSKTRAELTTLENSFVYATNSNQPIPYPTDFSDPNIMVPIKYNYYDNYDYAAAKPFDTNFDNALAGSVGGEPIASSKRTLSMPTGSKVRILNSATFLINTIYYDERGRAIQTLEENIKQGTDVTTMQYDFNSRLLNRAEKHTAVGTSYTAYSIVTKYTQDKLGRVTDIYKKFGGNAFKRISNYAFDDMGRLKTKRLDPDYTGTGKTEIETLNYSYNIHNEITGINKDYALKKPGYNRWNNFFGMYLGYDNKDAVFTKAQLDGHVTGILWNTQGDDIQRKYDYVYDNAGRLINANFTQRFKTAGWSKTQLDFSVTGYQGKIAYDLNGNLLAMIQKGMVTGNAAPQNIDDLRYTYQNLSNKLTSVSDVGTAGAANGKQGDFVDAPSTLDDYVYDDNGNLIIDLNKTVQDLAGAAGNGITYNFLDKPEQINLKGKGKITIVYDADGNKLQRTYTPNNTALPSTLTTYINGFVYKHNVLQFINFEEGRLRIMQPVNTNNNYDYLTIDGSNTMPGSKKGVYDFFVRDYQSNVRMVLTEEIHIGSNICTMETARAVNEEPIFGKTDANGVPIAGNEVQARFLTSQIPGQAFNQGWTNPAIGNYVSKLFKPSTGETSPTSVGPNSLLKVMAGDKVSATTIYYYKNPVINSTNNTSTLTNIITSLVSAINGSAATGGIVHGVPGTATNIGNNLNSNVPFVIATSPDAGNTLGNNPKAYLTVLFFDERFNFVSEGSTTKRVGDPGNGQAPLVMDNIKAPKNGYAYIYISNESIEPVYFDNLRIVHERGRITEENHYYAYGLKIAGISSTKAGDVNEGELKNRYLYNEKELWEEGDLNWYDYGFRNYDPQIGRFPQLDPLTREYPELTNYQYASCDPIMNIDIDGLEGFNAVQTLANVTVKSVKHTAAPLLSAASKAVTLKQVLTFSTLFVKAGQAVNVVKSGNQSLVHSEQSPITQHLQSVRKSDSINNSPLTGLRLKNRLEEYIEEIEHEEHIDDLVQQGIWDRNLTQEEARKNFINMNLSLVVPLPAVKYANTAINTTIKLNESRDFSQLQSIVKTMSKGPKGLDAFFKSKGTTEISKDALLSYKELATRMLNGKKGAYQKLTEITRKLHNDRLEMINKALKK